jgi:ParB family chromosome partitioning protein
LLKLPEEVKNLLADRSISMGHARALISVEDPDIQTRIADQVAEKSLSVRDVEKMINNLKTRNRDRIPQEPDPNLLALEEDLIKILGTKTITSGTQKKGLIKIHFYSLEDLNRIHEIIKGEKA